MGFNQRQCVAEWEDLWGSFLLPHHLLVLSDSSLSLSVLPLTRLPNKVSNKS